MVVELLGKIEKTEKTGALIHIGFELSLLLKGIDGLLEIVGSFILLYLNPNRMSRLAMALTRRRLARAPRDFIANAVVGFSNSFSISTQYFGVLYLASHGIIKIILVFLLWRKKLWAYPLTVVSLVLFIAYQIYRYTFTHSVILILLTVFDLLMAVLTIKEYQRIKAHLCRYGT